MSSITIDGITPHLDALIRLSGGFANQALSKVGADLQKSMKAKSLSLGTHSWSQKFDTHARRKISHGGSKRAYSRFSKKSGGELNGMESFVKFKLYPTSHKVVVGFINTKSYQAYRFVGGVQSNLVRVKGQSPREIAEKMDKGGREELSQKQRAFFRASGFYGIAKRGYVTKVARPVVRPVIASSMGSMKKRFKDAYKEAIDEASINTQPARKVG